MQNCVLNDEEYMKIALHMAKRAEKQDEIPIGAIIVKEGKIIAKAYNKRNKSRNAIDHAEVVAIAKACKIVGDWRLNGCTLYVTLEPCAMCAGACVNARLDAVVYGAYDRNAGCCGSVMDVPKHFTMNHNLSVRSGVLESECSSMLKEYFKKKRLK